MLILLVYANSSTHCTFEFRGAMLTTLLRCKATNYVADGLALTQFLCFACESYLPYATQASVELNHE